VPLAIGQRLAPRALVMAIRFALTEGNVHCMTLGLASIAQMDDAVERAMGVVKG
jgi:hypothetical protein